MNRKQFLAYFQANEKKFQCQRRRCKSYQIREICKCHASNAELNLAENEIIKSCQKKQEYQRNISKNFKKEVGEYAVIHGMQATIKVFSKKYPNIQFNWTSVNCWKDKSKSRSDSGDYKETGRPNMEI